LRAVLHTLRDRLPVNEAAHLGAQLPMLIRGIYYEGWTPADKPEKMHRDEFLARIHAQFRDDPAIDPVRVAQAVLEVISAELPHPNRRTSAKFTRCGKPRPGRG
jgi:uncharacterized protein (DUF2267 family)